MDRLVGDNPLLGWAVWFGVRAAVVIGACGLSAFLLL